MKRGIEKFRIEGQVDDAAVVKTAEKIIRDFKFVNPPINPEFIAESLGINVVYAKFQSSTSNILHGFYNSSEGEIVVNSEDETFEKVFTAAHELGHALLHNNYAGSKFYVPRYKNGYTSERKNEDDQNKHNKCEFQADLFAKNLLVPQALFEKYAPFATSHQLSVMFMASPKCFPWHMDK